MATEHSAAPQGSSSPQPGAAPASSPGSAPASSTVDKGTAPPEQDWQTRYTELEGKYKPYADTGVDAGTIAEFKALGYSPKQIREALEWSRGVAADLQAGKLRPFDPNAKPEKKEPEADPFEDFEGLDGREQAKRLTGRVRGDIETLLAQKLDEIRNENKGFQTNLASQMQLLVKLGKIGAKYPNLDIDKIVERATKTAGLSPLELLDLVTELETAPADREAAVKQAREDAKREAQLEYEKQRVPMLTRPTPRLVRVNPDDKSGEKRQGRLERFVTRLAEQERKIG